MLIIPACAVSYVKYLASSGLSFTARRTSIVLNRKHINAVEMLRSLLLSSPGFPPLLLTEFCPAQSDVLESTRQEAVCSSINAVWDKDGIFLSTFGKEDQMRKPALSTTSLMVCMLSLPIPR